MCIHTKFLLYGSFRWYIIIILSTKLLSIISWTTSFHRGAFSILREITPENLFKLHFTPRNGKKRRKSELSQWIGYYALVVFKKVRNKTLFFSSIIYTFLAPQNQWHYNCKPFYGNDILLCIKVFCIPREEPFVNSRNH